MIPPCGLTSGNGRSAGAAHRGRSRGRGAHEDPARPRSNDYTPDAAAARARIRARATGVALPHVDHYSLTRLVAGNVEQFIGVAQVPIGLAGPLLVNGEHAQGEFYVPLATAEGTLVASYNRGMRLLHEAGGVTDHR